MADRKKEKGIKGQINATTLYCFVFWPAAANKNDSYEIANNKSSPQAKPVSLATISEVLDAYKGIPDKIPTKMISEPPLPIPFSVINSDIHITSAEPADRVRTEEM